MATVSISPPKIACFTSSRSSVAFNSSITALCLILDDDQFQLNLPIEHVRPSDFHSSRRRSRQLFHNAKPENLSGNHAATTNPHPCVRSCYAPSATSACLTPILRIALGVNFAGHGFIRIHNGVEAFAQTTAEHLANPRSRIASPTRSATPFPSSKPILGLTLILGVIHISRCTCLRCGLHDAPHHRRHRKPAVELSPASNSSTASSSSSPVSHRAQRPRHSTTTCVDAIPVSLKMTTETDDQQQTAEPGTPRKSATMITMAEHEAGKASHSHPAPSPPPKHGSGRSWPGTRSAPIRWTSSKHSSPTSARSTATAPLATIAAMACGMALFHGEPVLVIGNLKGRTLKERVARKFGIARPRGLSQGPARHEDRRKIRPPRSSPSSISPEPTPASEPKSAARAKPSPATSSRCPASASPPSPPSPAKAAPAEHSPSQSPTASSCSRTPSTPSSRPRAAPPSCGRTPARSSRPPPLSNTPPATSNCSAASTMSCPSPRWNAERSRRRHGHGRRKAAGTISPTPRSPIDELLEQRYTKFRNIAQFYTTA